MSKTEHDILTDRITEWRARLSSHGSGAGGSDWTVWNATCANRWPGW